MSSSTSALFAWGPQANDDKPAPPELTPSEVALAKVLAAIETWRKAGGHDGSKASDLLCMACAPLVAEGVLFPGTGQPVAFGAALLDRARKAGVL